MESKVSFLVDTLLRVPEFRSTVMSMLRPMDIIRLVFASGIRTTPTERKKYIGLWRQIFFDMRWVNVLKEKDCIVTVVGKDLRRLHTAIQNGDYTLDASLLKLVIVIGEENEVRSIEHDHRVTESFDTTVRWHKIEPSFFTHLEIDQKPVDDVQIYVYSMDQNSWISFGRSWFDMLFMRYESLRKSSVGGSKRYLTADDVWESEFQLLESDFKAHTFDSIRVQYIVQTQKLSKRSAGFYFTPRRACQALLRGASRGIEV